MADTGVSDDTFVQPKGALATGKSGGKASGSNGVGVPVPAGVTQQMGASGTPNLAGLTQPDELSYALREPTRRMELFEEMRVSDEAINSAITAREQLIMQSNWQLNPATDQPQDREIADFVEDNLYPILDDLLRWLSGCIHYGFGLIEPVYSWSDHAPATNIGKGKVRRATKQLGRRIYLTRLAHIRQRTIQTFIVDQVGALQYIRQYVFWDSTLKRVDIPSAKPLLLTYNRQGDDYWGVPPTRSCYRAWNFKQQLEKLNLLGVDRFGAGTPVAEGGDGWTTKEYDQLAGFLKSWRASGTNYLMHPSGGKISIVSAQGTMITSILDWVKFYGLAIAKTFLTQASELGTTNIGSRALGEVFTEQAEGVTQADDELIASLLNEKLIPNIVDWNFGVPTNGYPYFTPSQRVKATGAIGTFLAALTTSGYIHARPEDEAWLRDALEMPAVNISTLVQESAARKATASAISGGAPGAAPGNDGKPGAQGGVGAPAAGGPEPAAPSAGADPSKAPKADPAKAVKTALRSEAGYLIAPRTRLALRMWSREGVQLGTPMAIPAAQGESYRTPDYSLWEQEVLQPYQLADALDLEEARSTGEVQDILRAMDEVLSSLVASYAAGGLAALANAVKSISVPAKLVKQLEAAFTDAAERARVMGANSVRTESIRQDLPGSVAPGYIAGPTDNQGAPRAGAAASPGAKPLPAVGVVASQDVARDAQLQAAVHKAVQDEVDRRESAARGAALAALAQATGETEPAALADLARSAAMAQLNDLSTGRTQDSVSSVVGTGFGGGRKDYAAAVLAEDPNAFVAKIYSAVMDGGTCAECAKWDGAEFPIDAPEDRSGVQAPNPRCQGGYARCRCVFIYIRKGESAAATPASKGPVALPPRTTTFPGDYGANG
jgi:hypothetical protein